MKLFTKKIVLLFVTALFITNFTIAQDAGDDPDIPDIPLDGGLSILLVAGAAYGGKKYHNFKKGKNNSDKNNLV